MSRAPLRTAFWALCSSSALSVALLAVSSFSGRTQLPPPASLVAPGGVEPVPEPADAPGPEDSGRQTSAEGVVQSNRSSNPAAVIPANPSIPVHVVSHPEESALAIGLEEALNPVTGDGEFIELPPPPGFDDLPEALAAAEEHVSTLPSVELDELIGRMQTNFDDLHVEFDRLRHQFSSLQSEVTDEMTAVQSSHGDVRSVLADLLAATITHEERPAPVEIDVTLMLMPLRGDARVGALEFMSRNPTSLSLTIRPELADGVHWATCTSDSATVRDWLQLHSEARIEHHSSLHVEQHSVAELGLARSPARGMTQARGTRVLERITVLPWDGTLLLRAGATHGGRVDLELRLDTTQIRGVTEEWRQASLLPGGTLVLTAVLDAEYRSLDAVPSDSQALSTLPSGQSAVAEIIALLQPRLLSTTAAEPLDVAAPAPFLIDRTTTR